MAHEYEHFSKFNQAAEDALSFAEQGRLSAFRPIFMTVAEAIDTAQRFYIPDATTVLDGKTIDAEVKALIRLPFDCTAVLSDTALEEQPGVWTSSWKISIGIDPFGSFNAKHRVFDPALLDRSSQPMLVLSTFRTTLDLAKKWVQHFQIGVATFPPDRNGYEIDGAAPNALMRSQVPDNAFSPEHVKDDVLALMNLCALLGLDNVSSSLEEPSPKRARARARRGKIPLYDYHVVTVDGEKWDRLPSAKDGLGMRSHLRRGHVRTLGTGRKVWVRSTFVRGSEPGFVDKDYVVKG